MKNKGLMLIILCISFLILLSGETLYASATTSGKKTIRVAWYEREGYMEEDREGNLYGFGMEYLNAVSEYTGWEYEFIQGTRKQCIEYLESGYVDLMSPVGVEEELEYAKLAREMIGENYGYIYKADNNFNINYESADDFERVTLGIETESGVEQNLKRYCEEKGIRFYKTVYYDSLNKMRTELSNGKIDAFVTDSYVKMNNVKVIGRFSNDRVTFASSDDTILKQLNYAMENIKLNNPKFSVELTEKYFGDGSRDALEYSKEEKGFLKNKKIYNVLLCREQYPISYRSSEQEYKGIAKDALTEIEHQTGIEFRIDYVDSFVEAQKMLEDGKAQILGGVILENKSSKSKKEGKGEFTSAFYNTNLVFVGNKNTDMDAALLVAVPSYFKDSESLEELYPYYEFITYETDERCLDAILNKEADVAVQTDLKISEIIIYEKYKSLQNLRYISGNYVSAFYVNSKDELLIPVIDKALNNISQTAKAVMVNDNIQHIAVQRMSFGDIWLVYKWEILLICIIIFIVFMAVFLYRKFREEEAKRERAYKDSIANIGSIEKFRIDVMPVLEQEIKEKYCAIAVDVDKFKVINDLYGYEKGDRVIAFLAKMLQIGLKQNDYITRTNADNFVILKHNEDKEEVISYLQTVYDCIDEAVSATDAHYRMMLKAGIYPISKEDKNISNIIDKANIAKKNIGQIHTSSYSFYSEEMRQKNIEDKQLENDMEEALKNKQFCVYLQPQIDLLTKKIVSAEALVRWKHPEKGMLPPFKFIPLFENNGFITRLDLFVWEETIKTVKKWKENNQIMVPIAINLSRIDVEQEGSVEKLIELMEKYKIGSKWIKTELTESMCSDDGSDIMNKMQQLRDYGFKIAVDDFGSGYSSLHLLKTMPIDILKIDKSFLEINMDMDIRNEIVIRDVVDMGKHLNLQIIVEGVETQEQSDFLEAIGCDIVQGYFYGKPMTIEDFEEALRKNHEGGR